MNKNDIARESGLDEASSLAIYVDVEMYTNNRIRTAAAAVDAAFASTTWQRISHGIHLPNVHVEKEIKPKMATDIPKILDTILMKIKTEMIFNNNNNGKYVNEMWLFAHCRSFACVPFAFS